MECFPQKAIGRSSLTHDHAIHHSTPSGVDLLRPQVAIHDGEIATSVREFQCPALGTEVCSTLRLPSLSTPRAGSRQALQPLAILELAPIGRGYDIQSVQVLGISTRGPVSPVGWVFWNLASLSPQS